MDIREIYKHCFEKILLTKENSLMKTKEITASLFKTKKRIGFKT